MGDVRLWADAPTNDGHDTGIDIVAKDDISSSLTGEPRYAGYVIVSASDFSKNAIAHAEQTGTLLIAPEKMDESNVVQNHFNETVKEVVRSFAGFAADSTLMAHNANFDMTFFYLAYEDVLGIPPTNDFVDTLRVARFRHHGSRIVGSDIPTHAISEKRELVQCVRSSTEIAKEGGMFMAIMHPGNLDFDALAKLGICGKGCLSSGRDKANPISIWYGVFCEIMMRPR